MPGNIVPDAVKITGEYCSERDKYIEDCYCGYKNKGGIFFEIKKIRTAKIFFEKDKICRGILLEVE
jgi:hypothetical protein